MSKLKIATLHCLGSNPHKHATQKWHFKHCAEACVGLADWIYPAGPNLLEPEIVFNLLKHGMGCTDEEVEAFGLEEPRCWFRFTDNRYVGLEASMTYLAEFCRHERPDGISGYSNGGGAALLVAAAREAGHPDFQSIRFVLSFAGPTSEVMQRHLRNYLGTHPRITVPTMIFGSRRDPMLASADQMANNLFERCELAITNDERPYANHALPEQIATYEPVVKFLAAQRA